MKEKQEFSILHISDLHFTEGTDLSNPAHAHSVPHLVGLESAVKSLGINDMTVVSGDISNRGDKQSLINASGYIFDTIPIGEGKVTGLKISPEQCGIVPGNHDAWNGIKKNGSLQERRQRSLEHYNFAFNQHSIPENSGSYYRWVEKEDVGIYFVFVDSCFLGDTETDSDSHFGKIRYDQAVAKGKLSVKQTEALLELHDIGMRGSLNKSDGSDGYIDKNMFSQSLKILVMHHYLFEPPGHSSDYFMRVKDRDLVFRNIAMADFDMLLCGHKHIPSFDIHCYGHHFDGRSTNRYLINCFRRMIGLHSLPVQLKDDNGNFLSKALTMLSNLLVKMKRNESPNSDSKKVADDVLELLKEGLVNPENLEREVMEFIVSEGVSGAEVIDKSELNDIKKRITTGLRIEDRKKLSIVSRNIVGLSKSLASKPFIQSMSGSSTKAICNKERIRYFNQYTIVKDSSGWRVKLNRYHWDSSSNSFDIKNPFISEHVVEKLISG